jgi:predicted transposase YdaD
MPLPEDVVPLVRQFASNSYRYLFRHPDNVADLLRWREPRLARRFTFADLTVLPDTFVTADFAALESDVLLRLPFRLRPGADGTLELFLLIEHQSEPDDLMLFRVTRYVTLVYERQAADWLKAHSNLRGFQFQPVRPIVFYSGTRTWDRLKPMEELVRGGKLFAKRLPHLEPEFINLAATSRQELQGQVGTLGWVLWLIQQRRQKADVFRDVLRQTMQQVDRLHAGSHGRWEHLLWFAHALVYHAREGGERQRMAEFIRETVRTSERPEVQSMAKTIAEALIEEGKEQGALETRREDLIRMLRLKFKRVPAEVEAEISATQDLEQLQTWLDEFAIAKKLADIRFGSRSA